MTTPMTTTTQRADGCRRNTVLAGCRVTGRGCGDARRDSGGHRDLLRRGCGCGQAQTGTAGVGETRRDVGRDTLSYLACVWGGPRG